VSTASNPTEVVAKQNKILFVFGILGLIVLLILNAILVIKLLPAHDKYETALGDFPTPRILNRVPGIAGSAAKLGEITVLQQDRCVNRATSLNIQTIWTPEIPGVGDANTKPLNMNAMKGCSTITMALQMPEKVTPGRWFIQGIVRDEPSGDVRYWTSEIFVVVP